MGVADGVGVSGDGVAVGVGVGEAVSVGVGVGDGVGLSAGVGAGVDAGVTVEPGRHLPVVRAAWITVPSPLSVAG